MSNTKSRYEILDHTADLKIRAYGASLEELFNNILIAIAEAIKPEILDSKFLAKEIKIQSPNLENLLIDFLSEVIYQSDLNDSVYTKAEFKKLTEKEIEGKIFGQKIRKVESEIKAVTWHDLEIKKENNLWQATIVFDI
jgi:SHS2 domain-containing protein